jgi:hypothetical protein
MKYKVSLLYYHRLQFTNEQFMANSFKFTAKSK